MVWLFDVLRKHINSELNRLQRLNVYRRVAHIAFDATQYPEEPSAEDKTKQRKNVFNVQVKRGNKGGDQQEIQRENWSIN